MPCAHINHAICAKREAKDPKYFCCHHITLQTTSQAIDTTSRRAPLSTLNSIFLHTHKSSLQLCQQQCQQRQRLSFKYVRQCSPFYPNKATAPTSFSPSIAFIASVGIIVIMPLKWDTIQIENHRSSFTSQPMLSQRMIQSRIQP